MKEKDLENQKMQEKIGIRLPWWIGYTILIIIIALSAFLIYKAFTKYRAVELNTRHFFIEPFLY